MSNPKLTISDYTEKSIVVRGDDTKKIKEKLKELGGKYNPNLKDGAGWIFSKKNESKIREQLFNNENISHIINGVNDKEFNELINKVNQFIEKNPTYKDKVNDHFKN